MRLFPLIFIGLFLLVPFVNATTLVVLKDMVNVRQRPDVDSAVLVRLNKGQRVEEIQKKGDWYEVQPLGITQVSGWIFNTLVGSAEKLDEEIIINQKNIVARMGSVVLSVEELNSFLDLLDVSTRRKSEREMELLKNMVREEIVRKKVIQEAMASGFDRSPRVVRFMERARTQALADHFLSEQSQAPDDYPPEQEIKKVYEDQKAKYTTPQRVHAAQIFFRVPSGLEAAGKEALRERAQKVSALARFEGSDFNTLANEYSEHTATAKAGGDLGWIDTESMAEGMRLVLAGMEKGATSVPYRSEQGWHIFKLLDRQNALVIPLAEVSAEIRDELRRKKMIANRNLFMRTLLEKDEIFIDEAKLPRNVEIKEAQ